MKLLVSNLDKVLYPEAGFTKGQVIDYYIRIAPVLLPHLKSRPITLKRYPNGVDGFFFVPPFQGLTVIGSRSQGVAGLNDGTP